MFMCIATSVETFIDSLTEIIENLSISDKIKDLESVCGKVSICRARRKWEDSPLSPRISITG